MNHVLDWVPVLALVVAVAGFVLQWSNRRDARRAAGLHVDSAIQQGRALIHLRKIGDSPIFDVRVTTYAGTPAALSRWPAARGEMTRSDPAIKLSLHPNADGHAAIEVSYRTMIQGGQTVRFVWDAVNHRRLRMSLDLRSRLGAMPVSNGEL